MFSPDFKLFQADNDDVEVSRKTVQSDQTGISSIPKLQVKVAPKSPNVIKQSDLLIETRFDHNDDHEIECPNENNNRNQGKGEAKPLHQQQEKSGNLNGKKRKHVSHHPSTPSRRASNVVGMMSSLKKKGGKLIRSLTPPRHLHIGIQTPHRQRGSRRLNLEQLELDSEDDSKKKSQDDVDIRPSPKALTLSSKFDAANDYTMRSSEIDPSPFQLDIPSHHSILVHCKICCMMENYFDLGGLDFDFSTLMPWVGTNSKPEDPYIITNNQNINNQKDEKVNKVLQALKEIVDDIIVEGFFREFYIDENGENGLARIETCVFSSCKLRRFIVCYRCSSDLQDRPLQGVQSKRRIYKKESKNTCDKSNNNCEDRKNSSESMKDSAQEKHVLTDVNEVYLNVYQNEKLQGNLNTLLSRLTSLKPFYDVAMTGHSFSGGIAILSSFAYALKHPATRVYCHVFGSPIVGGSYFRDQVHTLPNLSLIRVERSTDPFVNLPDLSSNQIHRNAINKEKMSKCNSANISSNQSDWIHAGHCLRLTPSYNLTITDESKRPVDVKLYRFDKLRPTSNFIKSSLRSVNNLKKLKIGNEIKSYKKDLEKVEKLDIAWVNFFQGIEEKMPSSSGCFA